MTNENNGPYNRSKPTEGRAPTSKTEPETTVPSKPATEADLDKVEERMSGFERSTLRWTRASFVVVLATGVFICLQWLEIRSGGQDTHDLAVAAGKQADKMKDVSDAADKIRRAAEGMVIEEQRIADNSKNALDASNRQAKAALEASILTAQNDQRAWLSVIGEKLTKEPVAKEELSITYTIHNAGKTPALHIALREGIWIGTYYGPDGDPPIPDWKTIPTQKGAISFPGTISSLVTETLPAFEVTPSIVTAYQKPQSSSRIALRVHIEYDDVFGQHHWLETCVRHKNGQGLEAFDQCTTGVGVDTREKNNKEARPN